MPMNKKEIHITGFEFFVQRSLHLPVFYYIFVKIYK